MVNHNPPRIILMFVGLFTLFPAITLNFLSGFGDYSGEFFLFNMNPVISRILKGFSRINR